MQEGRCTIDTWDTLKKELRSQFFPENVRRKLRELKHTGSIREYVKQFGALLTSNLDDKSSQAEDEADRIERGDKPRIWALKYLSPFQKKVGERSVFVERGLLYVDTWINQKQTKSTMIDSGATHNFITEEEAKCLRLRWEKDSGRMKAVNSVALPIVGLVKRTTIKLRGWKGLVDFVVIKMDDFDVVLGMEFLIEHQVIPMPLAKCLVITGSFPTVVQADIHQPNRFKMISTK
ncbi:uncharacterized protein E5676_scaffold119G00360 [Cucumis melo var. makuwa]|uniref:Retrotransposon gag domain-containing protein n=1 Tax=Cucumis melo var. makuwa TaxID=1194695 RepID=A0A5D3D4Q7_CUCMM|nr:uncharacterized protein E5676_scaffold119G00360 [Cucumis melo var. makuwa]